MHTFKQALLNPNFGRIRTGSDCNFFDYWRIRTGSDWKIFVVPMWLF